MDSPRLEPVKSGGNFNSDAMDLAEMGHTEVLTRKFGTWSILAMSFCVLGTWAVFAQDLADGLVNGGPVSILWGLCLVTFCNLCIALSLSEFCSGMPTALGQAYWVYRLLDTPGGRFASYMTAWINVFGWWTLTASVVAFMTEFLLGMKIMFDEEWAGANEGWLSFLVYLGITFCFTLVNLFGCRSDKFLPWFNNFMGVGFAALFIIISLVLVITVGTKTELSFQPPTFVFQTWINETGWNDGVTWFMGLLQSAYGLTAFDSVIHMVEEIPLPRKNAPKAMYLSVIFGAISGFIFMMVCLFSIQDLDATLDPPTGLPFIELLTQTIGVQGAAVLLALFIFNSLGQGVSVMTSSSRLTWGFARDGGLPWSGYFTLVDEKLKMPARALWLQSFVIALVGVLYLFSNTVLVAILGVSTIALTISYGIPISVLLFVGRDKLPKGPFVLGRFGPYLNWVSVIYCAITSVFFFFPGEPNPALEDMNWAIVVFGIMLVIAVAFWFVKGKTSYFGTDGIDERMIIARQLEMDPSVNVAIAHKKD
ncbi:putative amino acid permease family protein [Truncatella angustata]|uniref:Amino acid permease family protein n=1 Tax=Truncatella angustata TaxID=152316 RepID=A0A9P8UPH1_9PEZI|nr:putative amino acid permease family protein [Truncatella angustata]KAH6655842.1 putative amino acid permease family protein [Truncatella angustata]KAH8202926.1 hypothetical protein TruAng_002872 [Truncatella angustata]